MDDETSRRVLTEFKQEAVRQINEVGRPVSRVARDLDLRHEQLLTWPKQLAATEDAPHPWRRWRRREGVQARCAVIARHDGSIRRP